EGRWLGLPARQFLAQNLELQPLRLGGFDLALQVAERRRGLLEGGAVARVILRIVKLRLQLDGLRPQHRDGPRQSLERVLVLERHAPSVRLRLGAGRGWLARCFLGLWRYAAAPRPGIAAALAPHCRLTPGVVRAAGG